MEVSIIIVNWNTRDLLRQCLLSLQKYMAGTVHEVIVVDNDSPDKSAEMVKDEFPEVILIANKENLGFSKANNQGLAIARGRYLLLLNPDTVLIEPAVQRMMAFADARPEAGIVTCKLLNADLTLQKSVNSYYSFFKSLLENRLTFNLMMKLQWGKSSSSLVWNHGSTRAIDWAYGAVMLIKREAYNKIGGLDERFYIYAEEIDYYLRFKQAGYTSYFVHDTSIVHHGKAGSRQAKSKMFIQNYLSFYLLLCKHYGKTSYYAYRARVMVYLVLWNIIFTLLPGKENKDRGTLYRDAFKWHLSKQSRIAC